MAASLAVRPAGWRPGQFPRLSLVAALAGRVALGEDIACKWPNDLVRAETKMAGLLVEAAGDRVSDYSGAPMSLDRGEILASNGLLHLPMQQVLGQEGRCD